MFPVRPEKPFSVTLTNVRYMLRSNLSKTVLYEVRAEVEDTVEHDCLLCEVHDEVEERVE